eukprot:CAMPEP_0119009790 /NCGR_PEP_ID=MMETSP1176-20130426/4604_1 /TAXON_ID=265551 /ORGANISM="Synedropsis recta cf, Strain CCMP1620" /LENGTH=289 /DNA_ID=CAMNT_0006962365 /DNA_START=75 /DNA_END=947 /DNA_ORIENTATION=-
MASSMDVDPPAGKKSIEFHPLAIVHMSDQYTRITTGGSPLPKDAPVVGLLFGLLEEGGGKKLEVLDAEEIPTDLSETTKTQISLHQAVFPQHVVIGWYRVSTESTPTADDLAITQRLTQHFGDHFLLCFTQTDGDVDSLPMTLYSVENDVLVALDDWKLETSEAEKIAVETVVRQQPESASGYMTQMSSMEQALHKLKDRLDILVQFLQDTHDEKLPFDPALMRQVSGVVMQLGPLVASNPSPKGMEEAWLPHLAVAAKAVQTVQGYTEKVRLLQEQSRGFSGRGTRRY